MPDKIWNIPIREALTIGGLLVAIGIAWGTSQISIAHNTSESKRNAKKIEGVKKEVKELRQEMKDEIKENRRLLYQILRSRRRER